MDKVKVAVLGAGSWGTALAIRLAANGHKVKLCCFDKSQQEKLASDRMNMEYLPEIVFPNTLSIHPFKDSVVSDCDYCLIAVPSVGFASTLHAFYNSLSNLGHVIWATKGMDPDTHKLLSNLVKDVFSDNFKFAVLTGPSFAGEVGKGMPTAVSVASNNPDLALKVQGLFHCQVFRTYVCDDYIGAQVGGALKNVIAIATGIIDGLNYGANARAALITRGLAEIRRLGLKLGAQSQTFMGLSGMGDLVLTCTDNQSRNRRFGLYLGQGLTKEQAFEEIKQVVEGYETVNTMYDFANNLGVEMPITVAVYNILYKGESAKDAVIKLLSREAKNEF